MRLSESVLYCEEDRVGIEGQRTGAKGSSELRESRLPEPPPYLIQRITASVACVQKKLDGKERAPLRISSVVAQAYIAQDEPSSRIQRAVNIF
jgi:hypothetical protein